MNDQVLQTIHSCFDAIIPFDPLGLKEYLMPWWNQELFEEYGAKVPTGLLQNHEALLNPETAFKFFSERTTFTVEDTKYGPVIMFEGGSFRPGEDFALKFPRLQIFGNFDDKVVVAFKNGEMIAREIIGYAEFSDLSDPKILETMHITFNRLVVLAGGQLMVSDRNRLDFPGNENGYFTFVRNDFNSQDRQAAVKEVKKSVLWRALEIQN